MNAGLTVSVTAASIAAISAALSVIYFLQNRLMTLRAQRLQSLAYLDRYYEDVRSWGNDVVDAMGEGLALLRSASAESQERRKELAGTLWALSDRGRWLFANIATDDAPDAVGAYRGLQPETLNAVIECARILLPTVKHPLPAEPFRAMNDRKRDFVDAVHRVVDPVEREREVRREAARVRPIDA